jgi:hypothetical protein
MYLRVCVSVCERARMRAHVLEGLLGTKLSRPRPSVSRPQTPCPTPSRHQNPDTHWLKSIGAFTASSAAMASALPRMKPSRQPPYRRREAARRGGGGGTASGDRQAAGLAPALEPATTLHAAERDLPGAVKRGQVQSNTVKPRRRAPHHLVGLGEGEELHRPRLGAGQRQRGRSEAAAAVDLSHVRRVVHQPLMGGC